MRTNQHRKDHGSTMAELPVVIWGIFFVFLLPLINVATLGMRLTFLYAAAHNACIASARARTYLTSTDAHPPAVQLAQTGANLVVNGFPGIHITSLTPKIIITDVNTQAQTTVSGPLTTAPDTSNFTYQIQITLNGTIDPFINVYFPTNVPGLNQPLALTFSEAQFFENPSGLTI
jgi:hypothetical protein